MRSEAIPEKIGPYRIEARLGTGGMGAVYRAYDERLDRRVALKQIRPDKVQKPKARERFLREARIAARLNHPALVHVHDILEEAGSDWIVMELVEGEQLARLLKAGPLSLSQAVPLASDVASGLAAAHAAGILHRDLKSENVIVTAAGKAKILDFGLAKPLVPGGSDVSMTAEDVVLGTPRAMSPEQAQSRDVGHRSDLFSLGILLYEMLAGRSPFHGPGALATMHMICREPHDPVQDHAPDVPPELSRLVDRLLAKDPAERPDSAQDVVASLDRIAFAVTGPKTPFADEIDTETKAARIAIEDPAQPPQFDTPGKTMRIAPPPHGGERRQLTVLCCELVGDGAAPGSLDPEVLYEVLPAFQTLVSSAIERFAGHLGDVQGHRLVVYFGYPQSHEDNARRAVLTALEIIAGSGRLADRLEDTPGLAARAGIHTGPAVVLPAAEAREHLALGRTLDLAAGIQEQAEPGRVLVSALTHRLIEGFFVEQVVGPLRVSGFDAPLPVHRVEVARSLQSRAESTAVMPPLVARERELELLVDRFKLAREGAGQVVSLSGEAGMGKTRLLRALRDQLVEEAPRWLTGSGSQHTRYVPLYPAAELLRQLLEIDPADALEHQRIRLVEVLLEHDFPVAEVEPLFVALLALSPAGGRALPTEQRREMLEAFPALLLEMAEQKPIVLAFEDLQWVDPATLELVGRLIEQSTAAPILLVLTCRPGFQAPWGHRAHLTQLHLNGLNNQQTKVLIAHLTGDGALSAEARDRIMARADGIPLYTGELTRDALEAAAPEKFAQPTIPATLRDALTAKLDRLGTAKEIAQIASTLGRKFSYQQLVAIAPPDEETLAEELERLLSAEILVGQGSPPEAGYLFKYALLHEAARASLLPEERNLLTRRIAEKLGTLVMDSPP